MGGGVIEYKIYRKNVYKYAILGSDIPLPDDLVPPEVESIDISDPSNYIYDSYDDEYYYELYCDVHEYDHKYYYTLPCEEYDNGIAKCIPNIGNIVRNSDPDDGGAWVYDGCESPKIEVNEETGFNKYDIDSRYVITKSDLESLSNNKSINITGYWLFYDGFWLTTYTNIEDFLGNMGYYQLYSEDNNKSVIPELAHYTSEFDFKGISELIKSNTTISLTSHDIIDPYRFKYNHDYDNCNVQIMYNDIRLIKVSYTSDRLDIISTDHYGNNKKHIVDMLSDINCTIKCVYPMYNNKTKFIIIVHTDNNYDIVIHSYDGINWYTFNSKYWITRLIELDGNLYGIIDVDNQQSMFIYVKDKFYDKNYMNFEFDDKIEIDKNCNASYLEFLYNNPFYGNAIEYTYDDIKYSFPSEFCDSYYCSNCATNSTGICALFRHKENSQNILILHSSDGISWEKTFEWSFNDPNYKSYSNSIIEIDNKFIYMHNFYISDTGYNYNNRIFVATSNNGITWDTKYTGALAFDWYINEYDYRKYTPHYTIRSDKSNGLYIIYNNNNNIHFIGVVNKNDANCDSEIYGYNAYLPHSMPYIYSTDGLTWHNQFVYSSDMELRVGGIKCINLNGKIIGINCDYIEDTYLEFTGWDHEPEFNITQNTEIYGTWVEKNKLKVTYSWDAPEELNIVPPDLQYYIPGETVNVDTQYDKYIYPVVSLTNYDLSEDHHISLDPIIYGNGKYVCWNGDDNQFMYAIDEEVWIPVKVSDDILDIMISSDIYSSSYACNKFILITHDRSTGKTNMIWSDDGINWNLHKLRTSEKTDICCAGNDDHLVIVYSEKSKIYITTISNFENSDYDNIFEVENDTYELGIVYNGEKFVVFLDHCEDNKVAYIDTYISYDGINWTKNSHYSYNGCRTGILTGVAYGNNTYVLFYRDAYKLMVTNDLINWKIQYNTLNGINSKDISDLGENISYNLSYEEYLYEIDKLIFVNCIFVLISCEFASFAYSVDGRIWHIVNDLENAKNEWRNIVNANDRIYLDMIHENYYRSVIDVQAYRFNGWNQSNFEIYEDTNIDGSWSLVEPISHSSPPPVLFPTLYDFSTLSLGDTFMFGKYQVETEDPWDIE